MKARPRSPSLGQLEAMQKRALVPLSAGKGKEVPAVRSKVGIPRFPLLTLRAGAAGKPGSHKCRFLQALLRAAVGLGARRACLHSLAEFTEAIRLENSSQLRSRVP